MTPEQMLKELSYPNEEYLWFLNSPDSRNILIALLDEEFPLISQFHEPIIDEVYHWLYMIHDDFISRGKSK
jgi:hypothetical protein